MVKMLFDSVGKVVFWIAWLIIVFGLGSYSLGLGIGVGLFLLIPGPCVAIPAMIAAHGRHVLTTKSPDQIRQAITTAFSTKKTGSTWAYSQSGMGQINYTMTQTKSGFEPTVSIDLQPADQGTLVSIWMSAWTHGGLNSGKGTPFWTWGGYRSMTRINDAARTVA